MAAFITVVSILVNIPMFYILLTYFYHFIRSHKGHENIKKFITDWYERK